MLELILKDWTIRTLDPEEANLFYVPAFTYPYTNNGGARCSPPHPARASVCTPRAR